MGTPSWGRQLLLEEVDDRDIERPVERLAVEVRRILVFPPWSESWRDSCGTNDLGALALVVALPASQLSANRDVKIGLESRHHSVKLSPNIGRPLLDSACEASS